MASRVTIKYGHDTITVLVTPDEPFDAVFSAIIARFHNADGNGAPSYALQDQVSNIFVTSVFGILTLSDPILNLVNITERCQILISDLTTLAFQHATLNVGQDLSTQTKRAVFQLEIDLKYEAFGEEFIIQGGMEPLLDIIKSFNGNTQTYALKALSKALCYMNGMEYMKSHPGLLDVLVGLTYGICNITAAREAVSLIFVICTYLNDGFDVVHRALKRTARSNDVPAYSQMLRLLDSGDLDAQINSLTLVNVLLSKAPSKRKRKKLILHLDSVGLTEILDSHQNQIGHSDYLVQVERYEQLTGEVCSAGVFQLQALKRRIAELQSDAEAAQMIIKQTECERFLVNVVRRELYRYRQAIHLAFEGGVLINAHSPIYRLGDHGELKAQLESISAFAQQLQSIRTDVFIEPQSSESNPNLITQGVQHFNIVTRETTELSRNANADLKTEFSNLLSASEGVSVPLTALPSPPPPPPCPIAPPAPGQSNTGPQPTKPAIRPRLKMKPLHWKRIIVNSENDDENHSIWGSLQMPSKALLDLDEFAERFCISTPSRLSDAAVPATPILKAVKIRVLSEKRSQAIAIMMSQLPSDFYQVREAIIGLDSKMLLPDHIQSIYGILPAKEEIEQIHSVSNSTNLDRPEQFLLMLCTIPNIEQRLRSWIFSLNFQETVCSLQTQLRQIDSACTILITSDSLRFIISIILTLGNYMNGGTNRGQADGFSLEILTRLDNSKSRDSSQTLLGYIAQVAIRGRPSLKSLLLEMSPIISARNTPSIQELSNKLSSLQTQLTSLMVESAQIHQCDPSDRFYSVMHDVFETANHDITKLDGIRKLTTELYTKALQYFTASADYDISSSSSFFEIFVTFIHRFTASIPSEPKSVHDSASKIRRHAIGEKIGDGNMNDIIASIRKGHHSSKSTKALS